MVVTDIGLCVPQLGPHVTSTTVRGFVERAETLGFASLWVQDHFLYPLSPARGYGGRAGSPVPEPYRSVLAPTELLGAVAAWTRTARIGTSVLVTGNHWPAPLAQRLATLDLLSEGRLVVGLGVGWCAEEHVAAGTRIEERASRTDEFLDVLLTCWGPDPVAHEGRHFTLAPAVMQPKPVQTPRPRLLSGMNAPEGLARTAARFDGWNPAGRSASQLAPVIEQLAAARPAGLPPLTIHHRVFPQGPNQPAPDGDPVETLCATVAEDRAAGFAEVIVDPSFWDDLRSPDDWLAVPDRLRPLLDA
jgi:probable F420-dependent oxidoreductase